MSKQCPDKAVPAAHYCSTKKHLPVLTLCKCIVSSFITTEVSLAPPSIPLRLHGPMGRLRCAQHTDHTCERPCEQVQPRSVVHPCGAHCICMQPEGCRSRRRARRREEHRFGKAFGRGRPVGRSSLKKTVCVAHTTEMFFAARSLAPRCGCWDSPPRTYCISVVRGVHSGESQMSTESGGCSNSSSSSPVGAVACPLG